MRAKLIVAALAAAGLGTLATPAFAAKPDPALLEKLAARLEKLESRNAELEKEVKTLKTDNEKIAKGLDSDRISQYEPDLTARLKAVEKDALDMKKSHRVIEALDGVKAGASLTMVAQNPSGLPSGTKDNHTQLSYRADVEVELPLSSIGNIDQKLFGHFRIGQGFGLNQPFGNLGYFSPPNGTAFQVNGVENDNSSALLAQAWYQASIPLPFGGHKPHSKEKLELTFGKIDMFGFFDQNEVAGDEATQFLNTMLVHNPLLDAGGEVAPDGNGFQPGFIAAYVNETNKAEPWRLSLGYFGSGERGASFGRSFNSPLVIAQAEKQLKLFGGLTGNYRAYAWHRSRALELDETTEKNHTGFGLSFDQRVGDGINMFGRYGQLTSGELAFDRTVTLGAEISGNYWGRGGDAFGFAGAWMKSSNEFRKAGGSGDLDGDGTADFTYVPKGAEKLAELYYRYRVSKEFHLTPDFQWIGRPGANSNADSVKVIGVRAHVAF